MLDFVILQLESVLVTWEDMVLIVQNSTVLEMENAHLKVFVMIQLEFVSVMQDLKVLCVKLFHVPVLTDVAMLMASAILQLVFVIVTLECKDLIVQNSSVLETAAMLEVVTPLQVNVYAMMADMAWIVLNFIVLVMEPARFKDSVT